MDEDIADGSFEAEIIQADLQDLCRICASTSDSPLISLYEGNGLAEELPSKIMLYLPIKISEEDILPLKACVNCANSVLTWHLLYECCLDADNRFKKMLSEEQLVEEDQQATETHEIDSAVQLVKENDVQIFEDDKVELERETDDILMLKAEFGPEDEQYLEDESDLNSDENESENDQQPINSEQDCYHDTIICTTCATELNNNSEIISSHVAQSNADCYIQCQNCYTQMPVEHLTYRCKTCEIDFKSLGDLEEHHCSHDEIVCDICKKEFKSNTSLIAHQKTHAPKQTVFYCPICDWQANRKYNLQLHIKSHSKDNFCKICCNSYNSAHVLDNHKASHLKTDLANYDEANAQVACVECDRTFDSKFKLFNHTIENHSSECDKFRCDCGRIFETVTMLRNHEKSSHPKKLFECEICNKTFTKVKNYNEHKNTHFNERPFECQICFQRFKYSSNLSQHKVTHRGVKNFSCQYCDKKFVRSNTLNMHLKSHRNERNFICDLCNLSFVQQSSLIKHRRTVHRKCNICKQIVGDRKQLQTHIWKECSELQNVQTDSIIELNI